MVRCLPGAALSVLDHLQQGDVYFGQQRWPEALAAYERAVREDPLNATAWQRLASTQQNLKQFAAAQQNFERCLALEPARLDATIFYSFLLNVIGQPLRAIELLESAVRQAPQLGIAWLVLGHSHQLLGNMTEAVHATRQAVNNAPSDPASQYQLADLLLKTWKLDECEATLLQLLKQQPNHADAWALYGICLRSQFRHSESISALERSLAITSNPLNHSKLLAGLQYAEETTPQLLLHSHQQWNELHGGSGHAQSQLRDGQTKQKMRLGFVSADFARHPIGFLLLGAIEALDKSAVELVFYSDRVNEDEYTAAFRAAADDWRVISGISDDQVAAQIRSDSIVVLFDLAGHFGERLPLFALKPAPIQITWVGYVGTTGLRAMDFLIADKIHVSPSEEGWYSERVLRLPHGYACYRPPISAPPVAPLPAKSSGYITFGCFNNPAKYSPKLFDAWANILEQVPASRMLFKYGGLDQPGLQNRILHEFTRRGIDNSRVSLEPMTEHHDALAAYNRVDLALDTQPYSGGLTTCEALWMGVPVITFPGRTFAGRHSTSHLTNAGYPQFIATDWASYTKLAVSWSCQLNKLTPIRAEMRDRVRHSPLCDCRQFASDLLTLLTSLQLR